MSRPTRSAFSLLSLFTILGVACEGRAPLVPGAPPAGTERRPGVSDFVSADGSAGQPTRGDASPSPPAAEAGEGEGERDDANRAPDDGERSVEEGDIYRVLGNGMIANLNAYRGLQLIDIANVDAPAIVGRLQISGYPVEMYVDGTRVYVLMNNWYGYYGVREDLASLGQQNGGVVAAIDIANPSKPVLMDQAFIPGYILKSRLTRGNVSRALYVAASIYDSSDRHSDSDSVSVSDSGNRTAVKSFDVAGPSIVERTELDLGGWVTDIQATNRALLVARHDWTYDDNGEQRGSRVSVIDITSATGEMVLGDEVQVAGYVQNQFRMSLEGDILRVASGSVWGNTNTNHIETFLAADLGNITPVDHVTYGAGEDLYATLFLPDRAFAVTYFRVDPFHAFSITPEGRIREESEFVVSGWNDFFKPTFDATRLIGVGTNDEGGGRAMSVSLYDITNLSNPNPLVARADVESVYSWSEASWDHRAFSVIEDAVDVEGPGGVRETGLVLLPFSGYSTEWRSYSASVQIFTFSPSSLTRRGLMDHGSPVRRSFNAAAGLTANLSEAELSLYGTDDPQNPVAHGRVELAPNYADLIVLGDHAARVNRRTDWYGWYGDVSVAPPSVVDIIPMGDDPDSAVPVARIEVPIDAQLYAVGPRLVAVTTRVLDWSAYPYPTETRLQVWDLSDPSVPVQTGELVSDRLASSDGWYGYDCWDCGWYSYGASEQAVATRNALAFLKRTPQQERLGSVRECSTYPTDYGTCDDDGTCTYIEGGISCRQPQGEAQQCFGSFRRCTYANRGDEGLGYQCEDVDAADIRTETNCWDYDNIRYWVSFSVEVVDLRAAPRLLPTVTLDNTDEGVGLVADGDRLWLSTRRPADVAGANLPYVRYHAHALDLGNLDSVVLGAAINVPGELLAVRGTTIFTRDYLWGEEVIESSVNRLRIEGPRAVLDAVRLFDREMVQQVVLDGAGRALVTHQRAWPYVQTENDHATRLTVLAADTTMAPLSTTVVDAWAQLRDARLGRALFQVPGGLLVLNIENGARPWAQAFFALRGWPTRIVVEGNDAVVPAGRYGVYRFGLDTFNLLAP